MPGRISDLKNLFAKRNLVLLSLPAFCPVDKIPLKQKTLIIRVFKCQ